MVKNKKELSLSDYPLDADGTWVFKDEAMEIYDKSSNAFDVYVSRMER